MATSGRHLSWSAIISGLVAAMALEVLFVLLGSALGFALFTPLIDRNPGVNFGAGAAVIEGMSAVISLWLGGWVAGRLTPIGVQTTGWLHGFIVWCAATVLGVALVSSSLGHAVSGFTRLAGGGMAMAGQPLAAATGKAGDAARDGIQRSQSLLGSFSDEAAAHAGPNAAPGAAIRTHRDLGLVLGRLFDPTQQANMADNRAAASKVLQDDAGMAPADADREVNDWSTSYDQLQRDLAAARDRAEAKARVAAEEASKDLSIFSACAFVAFLIGAAAATAGATHGVREARRWDTSTQVA